MTNPNPDYLRIYYDQQQKNNLLVVPNVPLTGLVDQYGHEILPTPLAAISPEDMELVKRFLGTLRDSTQSRSIHRVLVDLLGRLPGALRTNSA